MHSTILSADLGIIKLNWSQSNLQEDSWTTPFCPQPFSGLLDSLLPQSAQSQFGLWFYLFFQFDLLPRGIAVGSRPAGAKSGERTYQRNIEMFTLFFGWVVGPAKRIVVHAAIHCRRGGLDRERERRKKMKELGGLRGEELIKRIKTEIIA